MLKVDLGAIRANWATARGRFRGGTLSAVVKADAYGLGLAPVAQALAAAGCADFWVNDLPEAARLRAALSESAAPASRPVRIFCLFGLAGFAPDEFEALGALPALVSEDEAERCAAHAAATGRRMAVALQLDTGLGRLGLDAAAAMRLAARAEVTGALEVAVIASHLAAYNVPDDPGNRAQLQRMRGMAAAFPGTPLSLSASSGLFLGPEWHLDMARAGSALYGTQTSIEPQPGLAPCYSLEAPVVAVTAHPAGRRLGYRGATELARPSRIATVAAGYADGLPQAWARAGAPRIAGRAVAPVGGVAMNLTMLDVTDLPEADCLPGAAAILLDADSPVEPVAAAMDCAPNVVLAQVGAAVRKVHLNP